MRVLFYAINGVGLGHLQRGLAIAKPLRELALGLGLKPDIQFLTTSDASELVQDFPVYKLPSKSAFSTSGAVRQYRRAAKLMASNIAASFKPHLLVLDTQPAGAFGELAFLKDYAEAAVFIDRTKNLQAATSAVHQTHLPLFDLILVPDTAQAAPHHPIPPHLEARRRFVGRVHHYRAGETMTEEAVRAYLGVPEDQQLIYISAGGGGDPAAAAQLQTIIEALHEEPTYTLAIGYGPLYAGPKAYGPRKIPLAEQDVWRLYPGFDLAISAAGYNSYEELLSARVPTLFFAQDKGLDQQAKRIAQGCELGLHGCLSQLDPALIRAQVHALLQDDRTAMLEALDKRPVSKGAQVAAHELLKLFSTLGASTLDRRRAAHATRALGSHTGPLRDFAPQYEHLEQWQNLALTPVEREATLDEALGNDEPLPAEQLQWAQRMLQWRLALGWQLGTWAKLLRMLLRGAPSAAKRARLLEDFMDTAQQSATPALDGEALEALLRLALKTTRGEGLPQVLRALIDSIEAGAELETLASVVEGGAQGEINGEQG